MYLVTYLTLSDNIGEDSHQIAVLAKNRQAAMSEAFQRMPDEHAEKITGIKSAEWLRDGTR